MQTGQVRPINETYCINDSVLLGKGSTGNVYLGFERNSPLNRVAIKVIDLKTIDNEVTRYLLSCEIAALSNLGKILNTGHENIVKLHDIVLQDDFIFLVMEHL
jgi:serine/threonine protein kinase